MTDEFNQTMPAAYQDIATATESAGFSMASDLLTGALLRTLAASKPSGTFLELGTGTGLSTSWILDGMDQKSSLISLDNDEHFLGVASDFLGSDSRLKLVCSDAEQWLITNTHLTFDYIFADTWHGKYLSLEATLAMLKPGGLYIIDDMLPQSNWPDGHDKKAVRLIEALEKNERLLLTKLSWSTGIIVAVKKA